MEQKNNLAKNIGNIGIVGGIGSATTAKFYNLLTHKSLQLLRKSIGIIIYSLEVSE